MKIGIITAMAEEMLPIYQKLGNVISKNTVKGAEICEIAYGEDTLYLATGGVGEINAAATVQLLADLYDVNAIVNFGFVGTLNPDINVGELVIADRVCHYQYDVSVIENVKVGQYFENPDLYFYLDKNLIDGIISELNLRKVAVASADAFVASSQKKKVLREEFGCDICEMELAGLTIACRRNNIPLLSIKVISDKADDGAYVNFVDVVNKGLSRYEEILPTTLSVIKNRV